MGKGPNKDILDRILIKLSRKLQIPVTEILLPGDSRKFIERKHLIWRYLVFKGVSKELIASKWKCSIQGVSKGVTIAEDKLKMDEVLPANIFINRLMESSNIKIKPEELQNRYKGEIIRLEKLTTQVRAKERVACYKQFIKDLNELL